MKLNSFAKILQHVKKSPRWVIIMTKHCQNLVTLSLKVTVSPMRRLISAQIYRVYLVPVFQSRIMSLRFSTSHLSTAFLPWDTVTFSTMVGKKGSIGSDIQYTQNEKYFPQLEKPQPWGRRYNYTSPTPANKLDIFPLIFNKRIIQKIYPTLRRKKVALMYSARCRRPWRASLADQDDDQDLAQLRRKRESHRG